MKQQKQERREKQKQNKLVTRVENTSTQSAEQHATQVTRKSDTEGSVLRNPSLMLTQDGHSFVDLFTQKDRLLKQLHDVGVVHLQQHARDLGR